MMKLKKMNLDQMERKRKKHYNLNRNHLNLKIKYQNYLKKNNFIKIYNKV